MAHIRKGRINQIAEIMKELAEKAPSSEIYSNPRYGQIFVVVDNIAHTPKVKFEVFRKKDGIKLERSSLASALLELLR